MKRCMRHFLMDASPANMAAYAPGGMAEAWCHRAVLSLSLPLPLAATICCPPSSLDVLLKLAVSADGGCCGWLPLPLLLSSFSAALC